MNNGWFMVVDPRCHRVVSVEPMERPEDNKVVTDALAKVIRHYPKMNTFIMDRNCKYFQTAQKTRSLKPDYSLPG